MQPFFGKSLMQAFETGDGIGYAFLEIAIVAALAFYIIFAYVVLTQVRRMTETLEVGFESPLKFLSLLHFLLSIGVFLLSIVLL